MTTMKAPKHWNINASKTRTVFANQRSKLAYKAGGEGANKVVFIPGEYADSGYVNTAFASLDGGMTPNTSVPIAQFEIDTSKGMPVLKNQFYDHYAEAMKAWRDAVRKFGPRRAAEEIATANIVDTSTIANTKALNILERVLGLQTRSYMLEMCVTKIPAPNLVFTADTFTEGSAQGKVPEMDSPDLISHSESRSTQTLYKNVGHIAESEEAVFMQLHNTMALRQDKTIRDMARLLNSQIATILESGTTASGGDWGVLDPTYFTSNRNPASDIEGVITTIQGNGFDVDYMAMHSHVASKFGTNDHIKGKGINGLAAPDGMSAVLWNQKMFQIPGFPPVISDIALTNTKATVGNKDAVWLGEGPTIVANYQNDVAGYRGWLIKQWRFPYLAQSGAIRTLTGVAS